MLILECGGPFQWKPSYTRFGNFRRVMWGWFAATLYPGDINELIGGLGRAGAKYFQQPGASLQSPLK